MDRNCIRWFAYGLVLAGLCGITPGFGQGPDRVFSRATVTESGNCAIVDIALNRPLRYASHFPAVSGNQLVILVRPAGNGATTAAPGAIETLPAPRSAIAKIVNIEYAMGVLNGPAVTIQFTERVFFRIAQNDDFQNLAIAISSDGAQDCTPRGQMGMAAVSPSGSAPTGLPELPEGPPNALLDQARAAVTRRDLETAIRLLTKLLQEPENPATAPAQELLGIARERNGQLAHAKAEYEEYLRRYPSGEASDRVRQRLAALLAAALGTDRKGASPRPQERAAANAAAAKPESRTFFRGSLSEYFYHDQMKTVVTDDISHVVIDPGFTTLQSELVSALDADAGVETGSFLFRLRVAAAHTKDFLSSKNDDSHVAQLFLEAGTADRMLLARAGRQYRSAGGLLGRIDGLLLSYQPLDRFRAELMAGFPVDGSRAPFSTHRQAYGASLAYLNGPWNANVYAMRQTDHGILDRSTVGVEGRYVGAQSSLFGLLDYDFHFNEINAFLANGSTALGGKTVINVALDHRRAPLLRTSNALVGQTTSNLSALLSTYSEAEIRQLALDRSAKSDSLFVSLNHTFTDRFSSGLDATLWHLSNMPASGGVPEIPSTGTEYYYSAHFIGTSMVMDGDMAALNLGYSRSFNANRYVLDINTRFPVTREFLVGPRVLTSYRQTTSLNPATRYTVRPTLRLNHRARGNVTIEFEGGAEWEQNRRGTTTIQIWNFITNLGVRVDF